MPLAKMAGASMTVVFVQDTYPYTGIGESNSAGLRVHMAAAREQGTWAMQQIGNSAKAQGIAIDSLVIENHKAAKGIMDIEQLKTATQGSSK